MVKQIVSKAIGIDLGTTNSVVTIMDATDANIIIHRDPNTKGETTPSCVWKDPKTEQVVVGRKAYSRIGNSPPPIRSIKRSMGKPIITVINEEVKPVEVSAKILSEMKRQIEEDVARLATDSTEWLVDRAIITVPAYFDQPQIEATRIAGEMVGLQVLELLHEPTAAACYHCWETKTQNGLFLVYDLGGGTFDVSILRCTEGEFEVLGISGNNRLGGDDIDTLLAEDIQERLIRQDYDLHLERNDPEDRLRFDKLKLLAEGAKKALSNANEFILRDTATLQDKKGEHVYIDITFERHEFEALIRQPIIERTLPYCDDALKKAEQKAGVTLADIDEFILVGGSTHIPLVREMIKQHFCADPTATEPRAKCTEPVYKKVDTIVALGAAIRAAATGGIEMYNPERTARVAFRGVGVTSTRQTYIGGQVESLNPEILFAGGSVRLTIPNMNYKDEQSLKDNGTFSFTGIPLQPATANLLTFEFYDNRGKLIAEIDRTINQSKEVQRPTGGSTGTAILSKALFLDINRDGKIIQEQLVEDLSTIPKVTKCQRFFHPCDTKDVRLPFYQDRKQIKEIVVTTDYIPPKGTQVLLTITIDELASITVEVNIAGKKFPAEVKPAPDSTIPTAKRVQDLHQQFLNAIAYLPNGKRAVAEAQYRRVKQSYEAAIKRGESDHAIHEFEEMNELVASISQRKQTLQPAKASFDRLVSECKEYNLQAMQLSKNLDQPHDYKEMMKTIEAQRIQGEQAYENEDQTMYSDAIEMLRAIQDHLLMLIHKAMSSIDTRSEAEKAADYLQYVSQETTTMDQLASKFDDKQQQAQIKQIRQELDQLAQEIHRNPQESRFKIAQHQARLEQIKNQLAASETHSDIKGLVKDLLN